jgi:hypothetical protein
MRSLIRSRAVAHLLLNLKTQKWLFKRRNQRAILNSNFTMINVINLIGKKATRRLWIRWRGERKSSIIFWIDSFNRKTGKIRNSWTNSSPKYTKVRKGKSNLLSKGIRLNLNSDWGNKFYRKFKIKKCPKWLIAKLIWGHLWKNSSNHLDEKEGWVINNK